MNKIATDESGCKSVFTLTFAVEVLGIEVWDEFDLGWLELGPNIQGCKIQYQLYPGQNYDIDVVIWPNVAKVWTAGQYSWIRTFQFLQRKWFTFSIRHAFPVKVVELQKFLATVNVLMGPGVVSANAKNDKNSEVLVPPLGFGERRYFGPVLEEEESLWKFVQDLIWSTVVGYIPASHFDGLFDVPHVVKDVRHQDTVIEKIRDTILNTPKPEEDDSIDLEPEQTKLSKGESKTAKDVKKKPEVVKVKFEILLTGDAVLAGAGRIVQFESFGDRPPDLGEIIVLISTNNLPAQDDYPIVFVNVDNLCEIPVNELKILRITELYTRWKIGEEEHESTPQPLYKVDNMINFNDHHSIPLPYEIVKEVTASFLNQHFEVQLRGRRLPSTYTDPRLFGYEKGDRDFGTAVPPKLVQEELDFLIAITKIDARTMSKGPNVFLRGEYPLYPPTQSVQILDRESVCTNDINAIKTSVLPQMIVKPDVILLAQMTLEVNLGIVGCIPRVINAGYSRMFCIIKERDSEFVVPLLRCITETNEKISLSGKWTDLLTGFALDAGNDIVLFLEGPKDGHILRIWERTEDFYPKVKPLFSCTTRYSTRMYPDFITGAVPFLILKMFTPLGVLLACPQVYARPALPLPTRSALLKIGRLVGSKLKTTPSHCEMPTTAEIKSLRLELCVAPRPGCITNMTSIPEHPRTSVQSVSRINWDKQ